MEEIRVLVVDDTIVYRKIVSDVLSTIEGVKVIGTANNGKSALSKIEQLKPDLVTLDIEMPEMNGIEVLEHLRRRSSEAYVVMLSTLTVQGGEMTVKALELGAFDFITKPESGTMVENLTYVKNLITPIVRAIRRKREIQNILKGRSASPSRPSPSRPARIKKTTGEAPVSQVNRAKRRVPLKSKSQIVTIGISTGGPNALAKMMPMLPGDLGVPLAIVQHMPPLFTQSLAKSLNAKCAIEVREAKDGDILKPNLALIAPGGKQMKIVAHPDGTHRMVKITDDPPENSCKPSADYLFRSVASHYVGRATGVIMTGMGSDGAKGLKQMHKNGSHIIAQDEATCTVFGMPKDPIESDIVDVVAPLDKIALEITKTVK